MSKAGAGCAPFPQKTHTTTHEGVNLPVQRGEGGLPKIISDEAVAHSKVVKQVRIYGGCLVWHGKPAILKHEALCGNQLPDYILLRLL